MLFAYGGACVIPRAKPTQTTFGQEFYSVLAGPGMNGISALICALFFWSNPLALPFVALNSLIGILNLGVGPILDGGHLFNLSVDNVKTKSQKALVTLLHSPFIFLIVPVIFYFFRGNLFWTTVAFTASIWFIYNAYNKADSLTAIENGGSFIPQTGMKKTLIGIANQYIVLAILALSPIIVLERLGKLNLAINLIIVELYKLGILKYIHF